MAKREGPEYTQRLDLLPPYPRGHLHLLGGPRPYLWVGDDGARGGTTYTLSGPVRLRKLAYAILREVKAPKRKPATGLAKAKGKRS